MKERFDDLRAGVALALHFELYKCFHPEGAIDDFLEARVACRIGRFRILICSDVDELPANNA